MRLTNLYTSFHLTQFSAISCTRQKHFDHPKSCSWDRPDTNASPIPLCWSSDLLVRVSEVSVSCRRHRSCSHLRPTPATIPGTPRYRLSPEYGPDPMLPYICRSLCAAPAGPLVARLLFDAGSSSEPTERPHQAGSK